MTDKERIIISLYTGVLMCDFEKVHKYAESLLRRPIFTHEFASPELESLLKELVKEDFLGLCDIKEVQ